MAEYATALVELRTTPSVACVDLDQYAHGPAVRALDPSGDLGEVISALGRAIRDIEARVGAGSLVPDEIGAGGTNVQGEIQLPLDVASNDAILRELLGVYAVAGLVSEELAQPHLLPDTGRRGRYLLAIDPLDGSSNVAVNIPVGTIFSVLRRTAPDGEPELAEFLQPGREQVCAGFALYGPATVLVIATAAGVVGFTLDRERGVFVRTHPAMRVPEHAQEFAINVSNERFWPQPVRGFVVDCLAGRAGPRGRDYNMRWIASLVAETYRILTRGGVFLYPADSRSGTRAGRLRLLYECNPIAFVVEQAGGRASTGRGRVLEVPPTGLHQRIPFIFGSASEVEAVEAYHRGNAPGVDTEFPLFNDRTLFRGR